MGLRDGRSTLDEKNLMQQKSITTEAPVPAEEKSFTQKLFTHPRCQEIVEECKETKFMSGMAAGTLLTEEYGGFMVQDAAYCYHAGASYEIAADKLRLQNPEFSRFYRRQAKLYQKYNQGFLSTWLFNKKPDSVLLGNASKTYIKYERKISQSNPKALCIAMLPCQMLWPKLANDLGRNTKEGNPYKPWFEDNKSSGPSELEMFIDYFFREEDYVSYLHIFLEGMTNELNFFRDACDQDQSSMIFIT